MTSPVGNVARRAPPFGAPDAARPARTDRRVRGANGPRARRSRRRPIRDRHPQRIWREAPVLILRHAGETSSRRRRRRGGQRPGAGRRGRPSLRRRRRAGVTYCSVVRRPQRGYRRGLVREATRPRPRRASWPERARHQAADRALRRRGTQTSTDAGGATSSASWSHDRRAAPCRLLSDYGYGAVDPARGAAVRDAPARAAGFTSPTAASASPTSRGLDGATPNEEEARDASSAIARRRPPEATKRRAPSFAPAWARASCSSPAEAAACRSTTTLERCASSPAARHRSGRRRHGRWRHGDRNLRARSRRGRLRRTKRRSSPTMPAASWS